MENRVLILGANGNLGTQLKKVFSNDNNYKVIAWDKNDLDITSRKEVNTKITQLNPSIIMNAAAYNAVDKCEESKEEFEKAKKINGLGVGYLAEVSEKINAIFVHYSTDYVFDGEEKDGYVENAQTNPINNYGKSKLLGEEYIKKFDNNLDYYIIRTSKLFGERGGSKEAKPSFFDIMIKLSQEKNKLEVVDEELSLFTYTFDLAFSTKNLLESNQEYGIYHLANEGPVTWYEGVRELFNILENKIKIVPVSSQKFSRIAKRPKYSVLLNTKFIHLRNFREALIDYLKIKKN